MDAQVGWARRFADACRAAGVPFAGMYVVGSASIGAFRPDSSDIDLVAVADEPLAAAECAAVLDVLSATEPAYGRGVDLEMFTRSRLRRPDRSAGWRRSVRWDRGAAPHLVDGSDAGLLADLALARPHAIGVHGPDRKDVFGVIPRAAVLASCIANTEIWAARDHFRQPVSGILNACRALYYWERAEPTGKPDAGEWALSRVDDPESVRRALAHEREFSDAAVKEFIGSVLATIHGRSPVLDRLATHAISLSDGDLSLRPMTEDDWPDLVRWNQDPEVLYFADGADVEYYSAEGTQAIYRGVSQDALCFIIEVNGRAIGETWLQVMNLERVLGRHPGLDCRRIDIMIGEKSFWGRGLGTRVIGMLTRYGFEIERADAILGCDIDSANARSLGAFLRTGYEPDRDNADGTRDLIRRRV